jgi:hypothetical protein
LVRFALMEGWNNFRNQAAKSNQEICRPHLEMNAYNSFFAILLRKAVAIVRAQNLSGSSPKSPAASSVREADRELLASDLASPHRVGALRGLLIAGAVSTPVWVALYLLLR